MEYKDFTINTLNKTSEIAREHFGKVAWNLKENYNQVLTETDKEIGKFIADKIKDNFPKHSIIDEELGKIDSNSDYVWVVDPIDGTSNFAFGVPSYGTLIGLLHKNIPIVGGLALPEFNEIYYAEKSKGTECNGKTVQVTKETDLSKCLVSYSIDSNRNKPEKVEKECLLASKLINEIRSLRMSNSVFDTAMVVKGKYGAFMMQNSKIWDNVAQQVLIEEAGGIFTDFFGKPIDYSNPFTKMKDNFTFSGAAPGIYNELQEIIKECY
ncbi:MAG: inositol monophosphatase [Patescibacteria group bacterium]